ncbi:DUF6442 family protein [Mahella sp.]|nr:DUF6442 family protein [Mahella sp.]MBZ4666662.1 hypothetical protein [Mahella sp.]
MNKDEILEKSRRANVDEGEIKDVHLVYWL